MSDKVKYTKVERWEWNCPSCDGWNEEEEDPGYHPELICDDCGKGFSDLEEE